MRIQAMLLVLLLAGCTTAPKEAEQTEEPAAYADLVATETTGVIRGLVVDEAIQPVENVDVTLTPGGLTTRTDAGGLFGFAGVRPGFYRLDVTKLGYIDAQSTADVVAGESDPPIVKVQLSYNPQTRPTYVEEKWDSFIENYFDGTTKGADNPNFQRQIQLPREPDWMTVEVVWRSTQSVDRALSQNVYWEGDNPRKVSGESPLFQAIDGATLEPGRGTPDAMTVRVYGTPTTLNQQYSVFVHAFFGYKPPEDWRYSSGDPVPTPP